MQDKPLKRTPIPGPTPVIKLEKPEPPTTEIELLTEILAELKKIAKRQDRDSNLSDLQWFSTAQAAAWCGDTDPGYFRKLVKEYNIPRHGARKLFDKFELDEWVLNPHYFQESNSPSLRRGRSSSMAAIQNLGWAAAVENFLQDLRESLNQEREKSL